ncbi:hypothetical protein [Curtobacterium flaccumfaciens]|uniref:hypothetical protein n=1 Tax=Curtobacterium flaccumfaciens TaxID=2035 RepID=UPI001266BF5C|nr:hypothetical protein [Curtobacterium flaccumfaciens]MBT1667558.1 hypothetical protein [Curtobacterium flaccumfaciens pv. flaccumfaciens]QFS78826.1 hypothetical protein GBG65_03065 [Curtobacterium flaccumfaciens pv. flaccumfaciens]
MQPTEPRRSIRRGPTEEQLTAGRRRALLSADLGRPPGPRIFTDAERQALFARTPRPAGTFEERRERRRRAIESIDPDCRAEPIARIRQAR